LPTTGLLDMRKKEVTAVFFSDGVRRLLVPRRALDRLCAYERQSGRVEQGGILLGKVFCDHDEVVRVCAPSRDDVPEFFSFLRRKRPAQRKINRAWNASGGYLIYLGEWHTHPGGEALPSGVDRRMIKHALRRTRMEIEYLYLIIAGKDGSCWVGRQDREGLNPLQAEE